MFIGPLLSLLPYAFGGILGLIGFILLLIGLKGFADHYNEAGIFNNALYGFITAIVGIVVAVGAFVATALAAIADLGISDWTNTAEWTAAFTEDLGAILGLIGAAIIAVVVLFVFAILTAFLYRRSLGLLRSQSGIGLFGIAGLLLLIGAVLTIVVIGFLLIWIASLLVAIAFFQMKTTAAEPKPPPSPPPPPAT